MTLAEFLLTRTPLRPGDTLIAPEVSPNFARVAASFSPSFGRSFPSAVFCRHPGVCVLYIRPGVATVFRDSSGREVEWETTSSDEEVRRSVFDLEAHGGIVARYCMAYQPGKWDAITTSVSVHIGISEWLHRCFPEGRVLFREGGPLLSPPLLSSGASALGASVFPRISSSLSLGRTPSRTHVP